MLLFAERRNSVSTTGDNGARRLWAGAGVDRHSIGHSIGSRCLLLLVRPVRVCAWSLCHVMSPYLAQQPAFGPTIMCPLLWSSVGIVYPSSCHATIPLFFILSLTSPPQSCPHRTSWRGKHWKRLRRLHARRLLRPPAPDDEGGHRPPLEPEGGHALAVHVADVCEAVLLQEATELRLGRCRAELVAGDHL